MTYLTAFGRCLYKEVLLALRVDDLFRDRLARNLEAVSLGILLDVFGS